MHRSALCGEDIGDTMSEQRVPTADLALIRRIDELHLELPFAGSRLLRYLLRWEQVIVGRRAHPLANALHGRHGRLRRAKTSARTGRIGISLPAALRHDQSAEQVWAADITCIPMAKGFVFLVVTMRLAIAESPGLAHLPRTHHGMLCGRARGRPRSLGAARDLQRGSRVAIHQFDFHDVLRRHAIRVSMHGRGCCRDNVFVERLLRSVKYEEVYLHADETLSDAGAGLIRYFSTDTLRRPHHLRCPNPRRC